MRILYFILWITLKYSFLVYFRRIKTLNSPRKFFGRTIYVSNHPASFFDPLVVAALRNPIVFFMTRADVFTKFTKPFLWASHMIPIYRQLDGENTKSKNSEVFDKSAQVLRWNRNLLIFGEGFTDDTFIRRLKPLKKGAVRIGFYTLEKYNWSFPLHIAAVGCNYTDPNLMGSELLIHTSNKILLNEYRQQYEENPSKTINELTKLIEGQLKSLITHVEDKNLAPIHEQVMRVTQKGMYPKELLSGKSLTERYQYSQNLALYFNQNPSKIHESPWKDLLEKHLKKCDELGVTAEDMHQMLNIKKISSFKNWFVLICTTPATVLGLLHTYWLYRPIRRWVEKSFKRKVFWGSVKVVVGTIVFGLVNIPIVIFLSKFLAWHDYFGWIYYFSIGLFFWSFIRWKKAWSEIRRKRGLDESLVKDLIAERMGLLRSIKESIPIA